MNIDKETEEKMILLYKTLSEKDRRRYAAIEAHKYGHGGITYIAALFGCDEKTIRKGLKELNSKKDMEKDRVRASGGGRKSIISNTENIDEIFLDVLSGHTAGNPMEEKVKWTNLTKGEIKKEMAKRGINVSRNIIRKLLKKHGYVKRKLRKSLSTSHHPDRDAQFKQISAVKKEYENSNNPVISVDTKKIEKIGNLYRDGKVECVQPVLVYDHDFRSLAYGKVVPYSIFDIKNNEAFVYVGTTHDTSEFACDAIKAWWNTLGKNRYPDATSILCLADSGGSNSSSSNLFKSDLQTLANDINMDIRVAHYPPGASKWNPIEHKVFPHITRALSGVVLTSVKLVQDLIEKTTTSTGLKVFTKVTKKIYETGRSIADDVIDDLNIIYDRTLGPWNYVVFHDS